MNAQRRVSQVMGGPEAGLWRGRSKQRESTVGGTLLIEARRGGVPSKDRCGEQFSRIVVDNLVWTRPGAKAPRLSLRVLVP